MAASWLGVYLTTTFAPWFATHRFPLASKARPARLNEAAAAGRDGHGRGRGAGGGQLGSGCTRRRCCLPLFATHRSPRASIAGPVGRIEAAAAGRQGHGRGRAPLVVQKPCWAVLDDGVAGEVRHPQVTAGVEGEAERAIEAAAGRPETVTAGLGRRWAASWLGVYLMSCCPMKFATHRSPSRRRRGRSGH